MNLWCIFSFILASEPFCLFGLKKSTVLCDRQQEHGLTYFLLMHLNLIDTHTQCLMKNCKHIAHLHFYLNISSIYGRQCRESDCFWVFHGINIRTPRMLVQGFLCSNIYATVVKISFKKVFIESEFVTILLLFYVLFCFCFLALRHVGSLTRGWTCAPCNGRWSLNLWTIREVPCKSISCLKDSHHN